MKKTTHNPILIFAVWTILFLVSLYLSNTYFDFFPKYKSGPIESKLPECIDAYEDFESGSAAIKIEGVYCDDEDHKLSITFPWALYYIILSWNIDLTKKYAIIPYTDTTATDNPKKFSISINDTMAKTGITLRNEGWLTKTLDTDNWNLVFSGCYYDGDGGGCINEEYKLNIAK